MRYEDRDTCDRCGASADRINVGWYSRYGYDGLCDACLDILSSNDCNEK